MPTDAPYSISDLARLTGLSVRTIRYYLAQGLIPAAGESGPGAHYGEGHLARLRLVRRLQQQHLPLAEIRAQLAGLTDEQAAALVAGDAPAAPAAPESSALDYVRSVLAGSHRMLPPAAASPPAPAPSPLPAVPAAGPAAMAAMPAMRDARPDAARLLRRASVADPAVVDEVTPGVAEVPAGAAPPAIERSQWERLSLGPNLELHIRRPLGRLEQKRVERLITIARQVLKEEQP